MSSYSQAILQSAALVLSRACNILYCRVNICKSDSQYFRKYYSFSGGIIVLNVAWNKLLLGPSYLIVRMFVVVILRQAQ